MIGSLLLYALGPGLNPFHSREEVRHNGLVVHPGVALHEREGPHRLPLLPVQRGQGQQYRGGSGLDSAGENPLLLATQNQEPPFTHPPVLRVKLKNLQKNLHTSNQTPPYPPKCQPILQLGGRHTS